jgi:hypothetical protein
VTLGRSIGLAALAAALTLTAGAAASDVGVRAIDPGTRVHDMLVVQGTAREADAELFPAGICDPVVLTPGRRTRACGTAPPARRLFVGYGIFGPSRKIVDVAWKKQSWAMWIDGQRVSLSGFGTSDRWTAANGRPVLVREWAIVLVGATGRHSIRYRNRLPQGVYDTTWKFTVASR